MAGSPLWSLQELLDGTITGDATLSAKLKGEKVYSGVAPETDGTASAPLLPYVLLSTSAEERVPLFDAARMQSSREDFSAWSADVTKFELAGIWSDLVRLLDGTRLSLDGYTFVTGALTLIQLGVDPSLKYSRLSVSYEVLSIA